MMEDASSKIFHYFKGKYDHAKNVDGVFQNLQQQAKYLFAKEDDINSLIASSHASMRKTCECVTWLDDVKKIKQEMEDIKVRYQVAQECGQNLVNLRSLVKLSEEMSKKTEAIIILKDRLKPENILLVDNSIVVVEKKIVKEINDIETFNDIIEKLLTYLKDSSIKSVAVWGMAGVGKTTILENFNNEVAKLGMFDVVIWITVSKEWSVGKLQQAIADRIKLNVNGLHSDYHMASLISKALETKRYLVILDEVFSAVDLRAIGIMDTHEHGKLVLATRYRSICHKMDLDEDIKVERMSRVDAWNLFRKIVGEVAEHPIFRLIAERILKECGELPHLIKVVARMLRNKCKEDTWQGILYKLQLPKDRRLQPMEEVLEIFRIVYDELDDNLKQCLLYGASFPEDHEICQNYLIECWKAEELINNPCTISNARQEGQILLDKLIEGYLLDRCKDIEYVKMPIIFRNMALRFINVDDNLLFLVRAGENLENPPVELWTDARVISLMGCGLRCLPASRPNSHVATTLFLQQNEMLTKIPPLFFSSLMCLRVLDLSGTGIKSLPESISNLTNLRGLYLNNCRGLSMLCKHIAKLKNLEVLEICQTGLRYLPTYIGELRGLQCLKVSLMSCTCHEDGFETRNVDIIPSNVVKKLSLLQELTIDINPLDIRWENTAPMIVKELATLTMLNSLSFYFPTLGCFEEFIRSSRSWKISHCPLQNYELFRSFTFTVGPHELSHLLKLDISRCVAKRRLKYSAGIGTPQIIREVLKWVCVFEIVEHDSVRSLSDFGVDVMKGLQICIIERCDKLENVVGAGMPMAVVFPWLKKLHLLKLQQFHCIWEGSIMPGSFSKLTTLTLYDCANVKKLVTTGMISNLRELQHLRIEKCCQITEVIASDNFSAQILPSLKTLELIDLNSLVSICAGDLSEWPSLRRVEIIACEILVVLPFNSWNAMQLQSIHCSEAWWEALVLQQEVKALLRQVCCFV